MDGKSASFDSIDFPDYAEAVRQYRAFGDDSVGKQPNDPKQLAARIVALARQDKGPSRFVLGDDTQRRADAKVDKLPHEIAQSADQG